MSMWLTRKNLGASAGDKPPPGLPVPPPGLPVIDARSGARMWAGQHQQYYVRGLDDVTRPDPDSSYTLVGVRDHFLSAEANLRYDSGRESGWMPIPVRFTHPGFFLQRVAFIPT